MNRDERVKQERVIPKISICVPVYNAEQYLCQCVDSILGQDYSDFELILVDDGSTDDSAGLCRLYAQKDPRVCVVLQEKNGGVSRARNAAIKCATGTFMFFVDADDWIEPGYLKDFMKIDEDIPYVACGYKEDSATEWTLRYNPCCMKKDDYAKNIATANQKIPSVHVFGVRYQTSVIKDNCIQFRTDMDCSEDNMFNIEYFKHIDTMMVLDTVKYRYRIREGSAVTKFYADRLFYEKCIAMGKEELTCGNAEFGMSLYMHWIIALDHYWKHSKNREFRKVACRCLKNCSRDVYFKKSLSYCRRQGTLDMKFFAICMSINSYRLYKLLLMAIIRISRK